jgi:hypothetical protein
VFNNLAERVDALVGGDEAASPEALMEASLLLYSLRHTQGATAITTEEKTPEFPAEPVKNVRIPYSQLSEALEMLSKNSKEHSDIPERLHKSGDYKDPRLFPAFVKAISDSSSVISDYVEEHIIPALGNDILTYLEEDFDIQGSKRHGRILKLLHHIKGKDILPLAEKAASEGSAPVAAVAVSALGEDASNEEVLLTYAKDRKAEVRGSAFTALVKLDSTKGIEYLLAELDKASISHLEDAISLTQNRELLQKVCDETEGLSQKIFDKKGNLISGYEKIIPKLSVLLSFLAHRKEDEYLKLLEEKLTVDIKSQGDNWASWNLNLNKIFDILTKGERKHQELLYRIVTINRKGPANAFTYNKFILAAKLFSAEKFFDECHDDVGYNHLLLNIYGVKIDGHVPDKEKTWDRRWGKVVAKSNPALYVFLYDDDPGAWKLLFEETIKKVTKQSYYKSYSFPAEALARAFANKHPDAEKYYKLLVKAGYSEEELKRCISMITPA